MLKRIARVYHWLFNREPALTAGAAAGIIVFFALRATHANGLSQGTSGGLVLALFGVLRQFVTSPAGRETLDKAAKSLPGALAELANIRKALGPVLQTEGGVPAFLEQLEAVVLQHRQELTGIGDDIVTRVRGVLRSSAPAVTSPPPTAAASSPTPAEPPQLDDAFAELGQILEQHTAADATAAVS